ncbi:MAG TPA: hypothetical protein VMW10_01700, partial [Alphaproteobacteria bacterium]|nr:hypothetical protein [Alphaproteobacteria bacterium]
KQIKLLKISSLPEPRKSGRQKKSPPSCSKETNTSKREFFPEVDNREYEKGLPSPSSTREIYYLTKKRAPSPTEIPKIQNGEEALLDEGTERSQPNTYPELPPLTFNIGELYPPAKKEPSPAIVTWLELKNPPQLPLVDTDKPSEQPLQQPSEQRFGHSLSVRALVSPRMHKPKEGEKRPQSCIRNAENTAHVKQSPSIELEDLRKKNKNRQRSERSNSLGGSLIAEVSTQLNLSTSSEKKKKTKRHKKRPATNQFEKNGKEKEKEKGAEKEKESEDNDKNHGKEKKQTGRKRALLKSALSSLNNSVKNFVSPAVNQRDPSDPNPTSLSDATTEFRIPKFGIP